MGDDAFGPSAPAPAKKESAGEGICVCESASLLDQGPARRFAVTLDLGSRQEAASGFVLRNKGKVRAFLNQCQHVPMELDWTPGEFFDADRIYLMCATHGALYQPDSGVCIYGPCEGRRLRALRVEERNGRVVWYPDAFVRPPN